ncbi:MAG: 1-(5-phosphoribosyl)-5-[(5-phosphoribosylamino)methylideneamino]imidazole-4-carboxamide isomerase [Microscillaceae bacterium]|jgi:phosphoribosylformimino-5-aminoimidazole carboxamide ribotide isomerase|nr:1-(5-phosphoribosyl)-5-[(5-phosphoribosylamino)methylideneamino]imidazole-4-carboxamide isomerase [Microscillaceae bacterium]
MKIIPAIDIINGECVRLSQGDYEQKKVYHRNPVEVAKMYEAQGAKYLHVVDLDGAKAGRIINYPILANICQATDLHVDFGGGLQSDEDLQIAFDCGAKQITGGSIAVKKPELFAAWLARYGGERILLGADVRHEKIAISGWQNITEIDLYDYLAQYIQKGIRTIICTDISKDGLLQGTSVELYQKIQTQFPDLQIVASGGVAGIADIEALQAMNIYGVIIGKALYENRITWAELQAYL